MAAATGTRPAERSLVHGARGLSPVFLVHSNYDPFESKGGIEVVVRQLVDLLGTDGFQVNCLCGAQQTDSSERGGLHLHRRRIVWTLKGAPILQGGNRSLVRLAREADVIVFQEPYPFLWPGVLLQRLLWKKPLIVLMHADPSAPKWVRTGYRWLRELVFAGATCVATSPQVGKGVFTSSHRRQVIIPLSVPDVGAVAPCATLPALPDRYALYVGRLARYKGLEYLLKAAALTPTVQYVIAGVGPLGPLVRSALESLPTKNLLFVERFLTEGEKELLISRSDFVVFPSDSPNEAFGLVQLEAMRAGKALVNTDLGTGVNYVAPHGECALTVAPQDPAQLAGAIQSLWNDGEQRSTLGLNGRSRYLTLFTPETFASSWRALFVTARAS
jgi:glycosyltransferase involved in cell wall biosynthesis